MSIPAHPLPSPRPCAQQEGSAQLFYPAAVPRHSPGAATSRDNRAKSTAGSLSSSWGSSCCGPSQATASPRAMGCPTEHSGHKQLGKVTPPLVSSKRESPARPGVSHCPWRLSQQEGPNSISETNPWVKEGGWSSRKSLPDCHC